MYSGFSILYNIVPDSFNCSFLNLISLFNAVNAHNIVRFSGGWAVDKVRHSAIL